MTLTKINCPHTGHYEYVNLDNVVTIAVHDDHYHLHMVDGQILHADINDTTITALVNAA